MGGREKALIELGGEPLIARIVRRLAPQVRDVIVSASGDPARLAFLGRPVVPDPVPGFAGPLAGILAGLDWAAARALDCPYVLSVPVDVPFLPPDLAERFLAALRGGGTDLVCAASGGRPHPVIALWPVGLRKALGEAISSGAARVDRFTAAYHLAEVAYETRPVDPFFNINSPDDLAEAERLIAAQA